ncbi:MAG: hypothetical protein AAB526_01690 [Patescibacteria group bacterium]
MTIENNRGPDPLNFIGEKIKERAEEEIASITNEKKMELKDSTESDNTIQEEKDASSKDLN